MVQLGNIAAAGKFTIATISALCLAGIPQVVQANQLDFRAQIDPAARTGAVPVSQPIYTFSDEAGVAVSHTNRMKHRTSVHISVFAPSGEQIAAQVIPSSAVLAPDTTSRFIVIVPMRGQQSRRFVVCVNERHETAKRRCGFYDATRVE